MGSTDILKVLEENDGIDKNDLFKRVRHLVNKGSFDKNIRSMIKGKYIYQIERIKYIMGVRKQITKVYIM